MAAVAVAAAGQTRTEAKYPAVIRRLLAESAVYTMINKKLINKEQARYAIENGEFDKSVIAAKNKVVLVLTQDWCSQWRNMKSWIYDIETAEDIDICELEYNKTDYFDEFRNFKERKWNNYEVPYLRFYMAGTFVKETNYISRSGFIELLGLDSRDG